MTVDREAQVEVEDIRRGAAGVGYLVDFEVGTEGGQGTGFGWTRVQTW